MSLELSRPTWLDWRWALAVIDGDLRLPGERVSVDGDDGDGGGGGGLVATPYLIDGPLDVALRADEDTIYVDPPAAEVSAHVSQRFHLDLDVAAVTAAMERAGLGALSVGPGSGWVRRPAAAALWPYCLMHLCGGRPDDPAVVRIFRDLDCYQVLPSPSAVLSAGRQPLIEYGLAPHRAANVLALAHVFDDRPARYDETVLRELSGDEAIARLRELPHIGAARARAIAGGALGHDDVLADLLPYRERLEGTLSASWSEIQAGVARAAPYRSVLSDTLLELIAH